MSFESVSIVGIEDPTVQDATEEDVLIDIERLSIEEEDEEAQPEDDVNDGGTCARLIPFYTVHSSQVISKQGKRKNFCPFCEKLISNYSRHLVTKHSDRQEMIEYIALDESELSLSTRKLKRSAITKKIKNIGNHAYNKQIVEGERNDEYLPAKRSSLKKRVVNNQTHVTCKGCLGFFRKDLLYRHAATCRRSSAVDTGSGLKKRKLVLHDHSDLLVKENAHASSMLKEEVFPKMQRDAETIIVQSDSLISKYGSNFRFSHRALNQIHYCSNRMRSLARLFITMQTLRPEIKTFRDCIQPRYFDVLVESVRQMSKFDPTSGHTKAPSVPPRLCSSLKGCANIIKSDAIKDVSLTREQKTEIMCEMNDFLHLMQKDWATEVSSNSEKSRKRMRVLKPDLLPDPDDIRKFSAYIHGLCPLYMRSLEHIPTVSNYEALAKLIIVHIITLNRRRPNETVQITLDAYLSTLNKRTDYGEDTQTLLTEEQRKSSDRLSIFYAPASKNLKKVPVLLTKEFHKATDALIEARVKIELKSKYLFGRPGRAELFDGSVVMKEFANKANLKNPSTFTANSLRHHAATSSQLRTRDDSYTKSLSKFMGHDLRTHEYFYEMPLPLVQKSVVGHELLQMTLPKPSTSTTANATPQEDITELGSERPYNESQQPHTVMSLGEMVRMYTGKAPRDMFQAKTPHTVVTSQEEAGFTPDTELMLPSGDELSQTTTAVQSQTTTTTQHSSVLGNSDDNMSDSDSPASTPPKKKHRKKRWTFSERRTIYEKFGHQLILDIKPPRKDIKDVWEKDPRLKNRTLDQVVSYVSNIFNKKQQIPTPMRKKIKNMVSKGKDILSP